MKSENEYIGDNKFIKFLEHYACPMPLSVVKMRFAGAICSPNTDLRPTDVISSLWPENKTPRLETKKEAELFFKFFMGLWDEMFRQIENNTLTLPTQEKNSDLQVLCQQRYEQIEHGFIEGFWGGLDDIKLPAYIAEIVESLSRMALLYGTLAAKIKTPQDAKNVFDAINDCDKMAQKSLHFVIENYVLPHISELQRIVN